MRGRPFEKGRSGNPVGRPKGSRHRISEAFIAALCADFEEHGGSVIRIVRTTKPETYLKIVADLVPRNVDPTHGESDAFLQLLKGMAE